MADYSRLVRKAIEAAQTGLAGARMVGIAGGQAPIRGLPQKVLTVGGTPYIPGPSGELRQAAQDYMTSTGRPYIPLQNYAPVDVPRAKAIAKEFEAMPHSPGDPEVMRAYEALKTETRDQYEFLKKLGVKFEPMPVDVSDPYASNPRMAVRDAMENRHMYYFPSAQGFGTGESNIPIDLKEQPMLAPSGVKIAGQEVPFNDLFRVVHDMFGHVKEGVGFRAAGEENAWRGHSRMYSPEALPAMTAELRGQNSWANSGPYAEQNKGASAADTIYAPQKIGKMPEWVMQAGRLTPLGVAGAAPFVMPDDNNYAGVLRQYTQ